MTGRPPMGNVAGLLSAHPVDVAPMLLGAVVESQHGGSRVAVRITEVEAYGGVGEDPGSHAYRRQTPRNSVMFGPAGHAYVYLSHGLHACVNVVCGVEGEASAVLIRAGEVIEGVERARERRGAIVRDRDLARGPGRLSVALGVTVSLNGVNLLSRRGHLRLSLPDRPVSAHDVSPRTGVSGEGSTIPWRFFLPGEPTVSPYRRAPR